MTKISVLLLLFAAGFAGAVDLEVVTLGREAEFFTDAGLNCLDLRREEFDGVATGGADHVVMGAPVKAVLVARHAIVKFNFGGQSTLGKQLERAVHGGVADAGIFRFDKAVQFFGAQVVARVEKDTQHAVALRAVFKSGFAKVLAQNALRVRMYVRFGLGKIVDTLFDSGSPIGH
ncbi:MAG TPA: hypothetical protein VG844_16245 [Terracidiphilus sp.]|nr:hypothetical protein [Terracidiphilus sp.]